jgi:hypothetical protein
MIMARVTKKSVMARRDDARAPFLFDYDLLPVRDDMVEIVRTGRYVHTGARLLDNEERTQLVVNRLCLRHGVERIARDMGISPNSIRKMRACLVAQGKMDGFVKRFTSKVEDTLEAGLEAFYQGILSGEVHPGQLPVGLGILFDKRALALGEPTSIAVGATAQLRPEALSVKTLNSWVEALTVDSESTALPENTQQIAGIPTLEARFDAGPAAPATSPASPASLAADDPAATGPAVAEGGGGGSPTGGA